MVFCSFTATKKTVKMRQQTNLKPFNPFNIQNFQLKEKSPDLISRHKTHEPSKQKIIPQTKITAPKQTTQSETQSGSEAVSEVADETDEPLMTESDDVSSVVDEEVITKPFTKRHNLENITKKSSRLTKVRKTYSKETFWSVPQKRLKLSRSKKH